LYKKKQLFVTRTPPPPPTASVYQPTTHLKHPSPQSLSRQGSKWQ